MLKRLSLIIVLLVATQMCSAQFQQDTRYSQYMFNGLVLNPAYAGTSDAVNIVSFYRNQWAGIEGAPKTISLSAHAPFGQKEKVGLGVFLENDQIGVNNRTSFFTNYSYKLEMGNGKLSAGISAGINYSQSAWTEVALGDDYDPSFNEDQNSIKPNFGFGLYYYTDRFYLGASVPSLLDHKNKDVSRVTKQYRQYLVTSGYVFDLNESLKFKPSILFKSIPAISPAQMDVNASFLIKNTFWVGATYRSGYSKSQSKYNSESASFLLAYRLKNKFQFGYAYDISLTELENNLSGTHEVMLGIDISLNKTQVLNPRYF